MRPREGRHCESGAAPFFFAQGSIYRKILSPAGACLELGFLCNPKTSCSLTAQRITPLL